MADLASPTGRPRFRPHKRVNGGYALLDNKVIPGITAAQLLDGTHRLSVTVDGSTITTLLDGTQIDQRTDTSFSKGFVGFRQDFVAAGNVNEAADIKAVEVTRKNGDVLLDTDFSAGNPFNGGRLTDQGLRVADRQGRPLPLARTPTSRCCARRSTTEPGKTVESARVYASAHGVYELRLNGEKVGDQFLAPGWTEYRKRIQHQTYDVTDQVRSGANAFGAELGDGWWKGKIASFGFNHYGNSLGLIAQLRIDYTDGTSQVVDDRRHVDEPLRALRAGRQPRGRDLRRQRRAARLGRAGLRRRRAGARSRSRPNTTARLVPQPDEPVRVTEELPAQEHTTPAPGVEIYDLGQNMVGVARMTLAGRWPARPSRIRYGEELNPDGTLYTANLRSREGHRPLHLRRDRHRRRTPRSSPSTASATSRSPARRRAPALADVTGVVWGSDLAATGDLETSDPMLNQLVSNISWGQRGNFLSVPTDTPARDERLGWTGDINVFAPTASYLRDTRGVPRQVDDRPARRRATPTATSRASPRSCRTPATSARASAGPTPSSRCRTRPGRRGATAGSCARTTPRWRSSSASSRTSAGTDLIDSGRGHWEDWLNLDDPTSVGVLGTMYYAEDARMLSEMAAAIGEDADAAEYAELSDRRARRPSSTSSCRPTARSRATARPATRWRSAWT